MKPDAVAAAKAASDDAVKRLDADTAFECRDIGRVWELIHKRQRGEELTEAEDRLWHSFLERWSK